MLLKCIRKNGYNGGLLRIEGGQTQEVTDEVGQALLDKFPEWFERVDKPDLGVGNSQIEGAEKELGSPVHSKPVKRKTKGAKKVDGGA